MCFPKMNEEFEDIKGVIRIRIYIEEEQTTQRSKEKGQTTQRSKEKVQKDKRRSTKYN